MPPDFQPKTTDEMVQCLACKAWRLENLYTIVDESGRKVKYVAREVQRDFRNNRHTCDIILKSRQHGLTSESCINMLDDALFIPNLQCGIIAHTKQDAAEIFATKIELPYNELPKQIRDMNPYTEFDKSHITFSNGSSIRVAVSFRSATTHRLLISEYAKICAKYPARAAEIVTGTLPSVHPQMGGRVTIEGTAEGACYDDQTEVLTDTGWKRFSDLSGSEQILTMDRQTRVAYYESQWAKVVYPWNGPMVEMQARSVNLKVTPNHMVWCSRQGGPMRLQVAADLLTSVTEFNFERCFIWDKPGLSEFVLPSYLHNQGNGQWLHEEKRIPIDTWLTFLGYWLSDGHVTWKRGKRLASLTQVKFVDQFRRSAQDIAKCIGACFHERKHERGHRFELYNAQLAAYLRDFAKPKRIPRDLLMNLSREQCRRLLEAVYVGDGEQARRVRPTATMDYGRIYAGIDGTLQDDLQELALKAGYASTVYGPSNNRITTFTECTTSTLRTNRPPRLTHNYFGQVYCVSLPKDHLLMVRRGGIALWCGNSGGFYELCLQAQAETAAADRDGNELGPLSYRFHFYPWYRDAKNAIDPLGIQISPDLNKYFDSLREKGIELTAQQRAWYSMKKDGPGGLKDKILQEHPSTIEESFQSSVAGAVYGSEIETARTEGRIRVLNPHDGAKVYTAWDLGYGDATTVWFFQCIRDQIHIFDYYECSGRGAAYHAAQVLSKNYLYDIENNWCFMPHDVEQHEKGTGQMLKDMYTGCGLKIQVTERPNIKADGIEAVRSIFNRLHFDVKRCDVGLKRLAYYRYNWDEDKQQYSKEPIHDASSHSADALQSLALGYRYGTIGGVYLGSSQPVSSIHNAVRINGRQHRDIFRRNRFYQRRRVG